MALRRLNILDLALAPHEWLGRVRSICGNRYAALASHHFLLYSTLDISLAAASVKHNAPRLDWKMLTDTSIRQQFVQAIGTNLPALSCATSLAESWEEASCKTMRAAEATIPIMGKLPNKPWISCTTLELVGLKRQARSDGDWPLEKSLKTQIQKAAKRDRADWSQELAAKGDWAALRRLRKGRKPQQGRLYNTDNVPVSSEQRAETFSQHLASVQWRVRPVTLIPDCLPAISTNVELCEEPFSHEELRKAIARMSSGKATKIDDVPIEAFKALAAAGGSTFSWVVDFCNKCWSTKSVPHQWAEASVTMI